MNLKQKILSLNLLIGIAGFAAIAACTTGSFESQEKLSIEMLDVGQGLSFLIRGKNCSALYDAGAPNSGIDTMLQNRGVKKLCTIIISSWHNDHAGGIFKLANMSKDGEVSIGRVFFAKDSLLSGSAALFRDSCFAYLENASIQFSEISRGDTIGDFLPWTMRVLFQSSAIRISDSQNSFLFMGDLEEEQEKEILELEPTLDIFALQIGNHGSRTSSSWEFLAQVQPKIALISAGKNNSYGYPHPETIAKLKLILPDSSQIFRTDRDGSIKIEWLRKTGMWRE